MRVRKAVYSPSSAKRKRSAPERGKALLGSGEKQYSVTSKEQDPGSSAFSGRTGVLLFLLCGAQCGGLGDASARLAAECLSRLCEARDDGGAVLARTHKIDRCLDLREHALKFKLTGFHVGLGIRNAHLGDGFFGRGAEVQGHIVDGG